MHRLTVPSLLSALAAAASAVGIIPEGYEVEPQITRKWGELTPWFGIDSKRADIPDHCEVTFVQVLSRHGARAPTKADAASMDQLITKIQHQMAGLMEHDVGGYLDQIGQKNHFLVNYSYNLGSDDLTVFGGQELFNSGALFRHRYGNFIGKTKAVPFIRAASKPRVVDSAVHWASGFVAEGNSTETIPVLQLDEGPGSNPYNPLSNRMCYNAQDATPDANDNYLEFSATWIPSTIKKLHDQLKIGFTQEEVLLLYDLCPYDTVALPATAEGQKKGKLSPFCQLFDEADWVNFGYYRSLAKYYFLGPGGEYSAASGAGWVRELIARLLNKPVVDTTTNARYDANATEFPLGKPVYADFSHDDNMLSMFTAMGLYDKAEKLDKHHFTDSAFKASEAVPFASRMYVEKLKCDKENGGEEVVRVVLNDKVMDLPGCEGLVDGKCPLDNFVKRIDSIIGDVKIKNAWSKCVKDEKAPASTPDSVTASITGTNATK